MKPFDIELAKAGYPVCTRDGRPVRILCFDRKSVDGYSILALVYEGEPRDFMGKMYISITNEYKDKNPHIVFTQGRWNASEGGEYEIRIYVPMFKIDNHDVINRRYLNKVYIAIYNAIKDRFGDNFHFYNHHLDTWNPMAKFKFYIQIPNFK